MSTALLRSEHLHRGHFLSSASCECLDIVDDYGWQAFSSIDTKKDKEEKEEKEVEEPKRQLCLCASENCSGFLEKKVSKKEKERAELAAAVAAKVRVTD